MPRHNPYDGTNAGAHPPRSRLWSYAFPAALVLLCLAWFAVMSLRPTYHRFRASHYSKRAERFITSGDLKSADLQLSNALRHDTANVDAWLLYARLLRLQGDPRHAIAEAQLWELAPDNEPQAGRALAACLETGNRDLGLYLASQVVPRFRTNSGIQHNAAILFTQAGRVGEARTALAAALALTPDDPLIHVSRAALDLASPDSNIVTSAAADLARLRQNPALFLSASSSLANFLNERDPAAAEPMWTEIIEKHPDQWEARMRLLKLQHLRDPKGTSLRTEGLWQVATNLPQRLDLVTAALIAAGPEIALTVIDRLPSLERQDPQCRLVLLEVFGQMRDWPQVLSLAVPPTDNSPLDAEQRLMLPLWQIRACTALNREEEAASATDRTLSLTEGNPRFACRAGIKLYEWGLGTAARRLFEQAIRGKDVIAREISHRHLIALAEVRRDAKGGLQHAEGLLETQPAEVFARTTDAWFLLITGGNPRRAQAMVADLERQFPGTAGLGELSALARYRAGEFEKAIQLYIAANPLKFKQPDSRVYFADALVKVGRGSEIAPLLAGLDPGWMYPETRPLLETLRAGLPAAK